MWCMSFDAKQGWTVLLIGGTSGTGKSVVARELSHRYGASLMELDDLRIALRSVVSRESHPRLWTFVDTPDYHEKFSNDEFVEKLLDVGRTLWPAINAIISKHVALGERIILEGDALIPDMLATRDQKEIETIFLFDDLSSIQSRQLQRNRHGKAAETLEKNAAFSFSYSETLREQAEECGFQTLSASPVETLSTRIEKVLP